MRLNVATHETVYLTSCPIDRLYRSTKLALRAERCPPNLVNKLGMNQPGAWYRLVEKRRGASGRALCESGQFVSGDRRAERCPPNLVNKLGMNQPGAWYRLVEKRRGASGRALCESGQFVVENLIETEFVNLTADKETFHNRKTRDWNIIEKG
uniref:Uncharacterized protein n=1 Tax=Ascaris lumbricoides TaxID=6252 RepID=A0A0M3IWM7_ASCLU